MPAEYGAQVNLCLQAIGAVTHAKYTPQLRQPGPLVTICFVDSMYVCVQSWDQLRANRRCSVYVVDPVLACMSIVHMG